MNSWAGILFVISLGILLYAYVIYAIITGCAALYKALLRRPPKATKVELPDVAIVIPAYNEEIVLEEKIRNTLTLDYPKDKLHVWVITDGSTDRSFAIASSFPGITVLHDPVRKGKTAAVNRAMRHVSEPITVFTDANSLLNPKAILNIIPFYADPYTGGVAGEKRVTADAKDTGVSKGEGLYWMYESTLKKWDSALNSVMGAAGEFFSLRTKLFEPLPDDILLDDLVQSMKICEKGFSVKYAPEAIATEYASQSFGEEWNRKVRIAAGGFQAMRRLKVYTYLYRFPLTGFQFLSHRAIRWAACPPALPVLFFSSFFLYMELKTEWIFSFLMVQSVFYSLACIGWILNGSKYSNPLFRIPFYFLWMHAASMAGFLRYATGRQNVLWEKAYRRRI
jgi:cellulose synthase/poly-beta-1,6-N-acetylglucosamine synthase-like glycosyltransferase